MHVICAHINITGVSQVQRVKTCHKQKKIATDVKKCIQDAKLFILTLFLSFPIVQVCTGPEKAR